MNIDINIEDYSCGIDETNLYDPTFFLKKSKESFIWFEGNEAPYIDFIMGYSSTNFGHCNKKIEAIVKSAIKKYDNIPAFYPVEKRSLDEKLIRKLNIKNESYKTYYTVGGAKAIDAAIKLIRAATKRDLIITFNGDFHGYSYGAMLLTDNSFISKEQFGELPGQVIRFNFPNKHEVNSEKLSNDIIGQIYSFVVKNHLDVAGIIVEPIQGAAGFVCPPESFLISLQNISDKFKIPLVCDEIQTGIGRTGSFFYINQVGISPDVILLSKSLAGGYYPLSVVIAKEKLFNSINKEKSGFDSTFSNNCLGIAIADKVVDILDDELIENIKKKGVHLHQRLKKLKDLCPIVKAINVVGLACSVLIAYDDDPSLSRKMAEEIKQHAFENHLIIQTAGTKGNYLKISPSFLISKKVLDQGIDVIIKSILFVCKKYNR